MNYEADRPGTSQQEHGRVEIVHVVRGEKKSAGWELFLTKYFNFEEHPGNDIPDQPEQL
jgi:hypothetical protein